MTHLSDRDLTQLRRNNPDLAAYHDGVLITDGAYTTLEPRQAAHAPQATQGAVIRLTLPYPPSANVYWRMTKHRTTGRAMMVRSAAAKKYIKAVGRICLLADVRPISGDVVVSSLRVYRPQRSGDLDNRMKVPLDALEGYAYHDDSQVVELHAYRDDDKDNPRVEIEIKELT